MYKFLSVLLFALFVPLSSSSQSFGGEGAKWVYNFSPGETISMGINIIKYEKDTLISGNTLQQFSQVGYRIFENFEGSLDTFISDLGAIYLQSDEDIVRLSIDGEIFDTLYQFNAVPETNWTIPIRDNFFAGAVHFTILDTFQVTLGAHILSAQSVELCAFLEAPFRDIDCYSDTVYQHIGSKYNYIIPWDIAYPFQSGEGGILRCFQNNNLGVIEMEYPPRIRLEYDYECSDEVVSSKEEIRKPPFYNIYPNPVSNTLHIEGNSINDFSSSIQLFNSLGNEVLSCDYAACRTIDVSNFAKGVYFLLIDGKYHSKVIVI